MNYVKLLRNNFRESFFFRGFSSPRGTVDGHQEVDGLLGVQNLIMILGSSWILLAQMHRSCIWFPMLGVAAPGQ